MAYRFDMQGKTLQQQIIVSKRDEDNKRNKKESEKSSPKTADAVACSFAKEKDANSSFSMCFEDFLQSIKGLTNAGINCRLSRLRWVENVCEQSADFIVSGIQTMHISRALIYEKADTPHKAGNYYNALMLYYEYIHGNKCPCINKRPVQ